MTALVRLDIKRRGGRRVLEISLPRKILTTMRAMGPESIRLQFSAQEAFEINAEALGRAITETYEKRGT